MERKIFEVEITHNPHTGNFFIGFKDNGKYVISVKVTEDVAMSTARHLGLKVFIG